MPATDAIMNTMRVVIMVSRRVGQVTFWVSARTSCRNLNGLTRAIDPVLGHIYRPPAPQVGPVTSPYIYARFPEKPLAWLEGDLKPGRSGGTRTPNPRFW